MPEDETVVTQPTEPTPAPATPSSTSTTDWEAEYRKLKRTLDGKEGFISNLKKERDTARDELTSLSVEFETFKQENSGVTQSLTTTKQQLEQANGTLAKTTGAYESLKLVATEFPDLVKYVAKGMIDPGNKQGDELRTFLTDWKTEFDSLGIQRAQQDPSGSTPPAPSGDGQPTLTLYEIQDKKVEAYRLYGPKSKEYIELAKLESQALGATDTQKVRARA